MKKTATLLASLLLVLFVTTATFAQLTSQKIDSLVEDALVKFKVAGASVAIVKDGKVIHQKGYGLSSITTKEKVNEHTNFQIASNSKAFTTAALSILEDEGKLKWTDRVKDHLPEFKMYNDYVTENFNIQDLVTHRSGLGLGAGDLMFFPDGSDFTIKDVLTSFQHFKPVSAFRTKYDYDNLLYIVAGEIVARVGGMSYEAFVQKRILEPLQMNNTSVGRLMKDKSSLATPHSSESGSLKTIDSFDLGVGRAAGGITSNVADMSKWMVVQLNRGKYGPDLKTSLFSSKNHNEMWRLHTVLEANRDPRYNSHFSGYGLGWFLTDVKGTLKVSHTGGLPGMLSEVTMYPDLNLGIVILTNTETGGNLFSAVSGTIADSYLGLDDFGWTNKIAGWMEYQRNMNDVVTKRVWEKVEAAKNVKVKNEDFIGVYEDNWFGKIEVFEKDKKLWFKSYRSPKLNGPMAFYNANTFAIKWEYQAMNGDALAMFSLDERGRAQSIKMRGISPNIDFSFDFQDLDLKRKDDFKAYEGYYRFQFEPGKDEYVKIITRDNHLVLIEVWNGSEITFEQTSELEFFNERSNYPLKFTRSKEGDITQVLLFNKDLWIKASDYKP
jgi:CubicO group peptidase (beta-lactamase class C family)